MKKEVGQISRPLFCVALGGGTPSNEEKVEVQKTA